jgi:hypothetical protein
MEEQTSVTQQIAASAMKAAESTASVVANLGGLTDDVARVDAATGEGRADADRLVRDCDSLLTAVRGFVQTLVAA